MIAGLWTAIYYPWAFITMLIIFILLMIWWLPKIWNGIKKVFGFIGRLFGLVKKDEYVQEDPLGILEANDIKEGSVVEHKLKELKALLDKGLISHEDFQKKKMELLEDI